VFCFGHFAEPTFPLLILNNRLEKLLAAEIRPERIGHQEFGVTGLPQKEIRQTHLTGSPYQQIRIREFRRIEKIRKSLFIDLTRINIACLGGIDDSPNSIENFRTAAVIERQVENQTLVGASSFDRG
jgi:hypothetical protein